MSPEKDEKKELSLEERRSRLERRAEVIRSRLFRHVDALDARRHQVTEVGRRAKALAPTAVGVVLVSGLLIGAGIGLVGWAIRARKKKVLAYRVAKAIEPFRVEKRPTVLAEAGRRVLVTIATVVASELARRAAKNAVDGRLLGGKLAVPEALPSARTNGHGIHAFGG